jgi:type II secretory pathway pseudopilin PulG
MWLSKNKYCTYRLGNTNKVPAFTIIEVLVTLMITSLVILISSTVYVTFSGYFNGFKANSEMHQQLFLFDRQINLDFQNAGKAFLSGDDLVISHNNNEEINYRFVDQMIVRLENENSDTFHIQFSNLQFNYYLPGLIDEVKFDVRTSDFFIHYKAFAQYSQSGLVNSEIYGNKY